LKKIFSIINAFTRLPEWLISTLVLFALLFIVFARVLLRPQLMVIGSDFIQFYFWEHFTRSELAAGRLPIWNPYFFSGYPLLANPQSLVFYPPAMLLRFVPLGYALGLGIFLHLWWAGVGMYGLTRHQNLNRAAAYMSAITFMLGGVVVTHIEAGHLEWIYTIAWMPWVIWGWQKTLFESGKRAAIFAGVTTAMMFLGGGPRVMVCVVLMLVVLGVAWLIDVIRSRAWHSLLMSAGRLTLGGVVTLGSIMPQLLPTLEFTNLSSRSSGISLDCTLDFSLTLLDLPMFGVAKISYDVFLEWERNGYIGAIGVLFGLFGILFSWRKMTLWKALLLAWVIVGFLIGVGPVLPFYSWARNILPILSLIRQPFTLIVLMGFGAAGLAGVGAQTLCDHLKEERARATLIALAVILSVGAIFADAMLFRVSNANIMQRVFEISTPHYVLALLALLLFWKESHYNKAITLCIGLLALDLGFFAYRHIPLSPEKTLTDRPAGMPSLNAWEARVITEPFMHSTGTMYTRTSNAQGYSPITLESYSNFVVLEPPRCPDFGHAYIDLSNKQLLRLLSVKYITAPGQQANEVSSYYPRVAWVGEAVSARTNGEAIKLARAADFDPTKKVIIEGDVNPSTSSSTGSIRITQYGTESLNVLIDSTSDGWFYINDVWYPGWKAWVNGDETQVYRANGTFRAVRVPRGQHTVFMKYESAYLNLGIWIAVITWLMIGGVGLFFWWRQRK